MSNTNLDINTNFGLWVGGAYPTADLLARYTQSAEGEDLVDQTGNSVDIPYISGAGLDQIFNFGVLSGDQWDKGSYIGNGFGLPSFYDFPYINIYYDPTSATTRKYWKLTDFHYRWIEEQFQGTLNNILFAKITYVTEETPTLTDFELLVYSVEQTELTQLHSHIGINDFQEQNNWYYTNEWIIRDMLQFVIEGGSFSLALDGSSQAVYWGDDSFNTVNYSATYSNTYTYDGKHLISVTDGLTLFNISSKGLIVDVGYWGDYISDWTNIVTFRINSNGLYGSLSDWDLSGWSNIEVFRIYNNLLSGDLSDWDLSGWVNISIFYAHINNLSGDLSDWDLSGWVNIFDLRINANSFSGCFYSQSTTIAGFYINDNGFSTSDIDDILSSLNTFFTANTPVVAASFNFTTNAIPTGGLSNTDKLAIETLFTNAGFTAIILVDS